MAKKKRRAAAAPVPEGAETETKTKAKRKAKPKQAFKCLCGCGGDTGRYFVAGHDARFKGWLGKIAKGEAKPKDLLPDVAVKEMGPWDEEGTGLVPTHDYTVMRPELD